jgi:tetratricopeptide (TPR) repeat protein
VLAQNGDLIECDKTSTSAQYYYDLGWSEYSIQRYENGVVYFTCAMQIDQTYSDARHMRGLCYELLNMFDEARDDYARVIELNPTYMISYIGLVNAYIGLGELLNALSVTDDAIAIDPTFASIYTSRGDVYRFLEEFDLAVINYTQAIELDYNIADSYARRGWAYLGLEDYQSALSDLQIAVEMSPRVGWFYTGIALAQAGLGNIEAAQEAFANYLEIRASVSGSLSESFPTSRLTLPEYWAEYLNN